MGRTRGPQAGAKELLQLCWDGRGCAESSWPRMWQKNISMGWNLQPGITPCSSPGRVYRTPDIPVLKGLSWQCTKNPQDTDFTNILGFRLCFPCEFGCGVHSPTAPMLPEKSFCPTAEFNVASIPKFQTLAEHFDSSNLPLFFFPPLFLQKDESLYGQGITPSL